jgi:putative ABC transport system permease protein
MNGSPPLPRPVAALLGRVVPQERRAEVLGDLCEDYARAAAQRSRWGARIWLCAEVTSVTWAWLHVRLRDAARLRTLVHRDARLAWRGLLRRPLASASATAMLSVGLVSVGLAWTLAYALLDRPVSNRHGHRVLRLAALEPSGRMELRFSVVELERIAADLDGTAEVGAVGLEPALIRSGQIRRQTLAEVVSPRYPDVIGMTPQIGRPLLSIDHEPGAPPAALISDLLWRDLFARRPSALGESLVVNGRAFAVMGVLRPSAPTSLLGASVDLWIPLAQGDVFFSPGWRTNRGPRALSLFVLPAHDAPALEPRLRRLTLNLESTLPDSWRRRTLTLVPGTAMLGTQRAAAEQLFGLLLALAVLILAVAGANTGGLLLAGSAAGRREAAIDLAIGAGPGAAPRRLILEGTMLGAAAGVLASCLYAWARVPVSAIALLPTLSLRLQLPDPWALLPALVLAGTAAGVLVAVGPAVWTRRQLRTYRLHAGGRGTGDRGVTRARRLLVAAQVAVALVLVVGAALFARSLDRLSHADLGVDSTGLVALDFDIEPHETAGQPPGFLAAEALRQTRGLPGVVAAAMANRAPVDSSTPTTTVAGDGTPDRSIDVTVNTVTAGYFETVGTPLLAGRSFRDDDGDAVAIVNAALARRLWTEGDALGRTLHLVSEGRMVQVIGVARDARYRDITESGLPHVYLPTRPAFGLALLVRTSREPRGLLLDVQDALDGIGAGVTGFFPRTHDDHLAIQRLPTRVASTTAAWLSGLAMVLCAAGLYGLVTWLVTLRQTEMAVRLALGATRRDVERLVLRQAFAAAGPGLVAGILLAFAGAVLARGMLYGLEAMDALAMPGGIAAVLAFVAGASWWPARRAGRTDPAAALKSI